MNIALYLLVAAILVALHAGWVSWLLFAWACLIAVIAKAVLVAVASDPSVRRD